MVISVPTWLNRWYHSALDIVNIYFIYFFKMLCGKESTKSRHTPFAWQSNQIIHEADSNHFTCGWKFTVLDEARSVKRLIWVWCKDFEFWHVRYKPNKAAVHVLNRSLRAEVPTNKQEHKAAVKSRQSLWTGGNCLWMFCWQLSIKTGAIFHNGVGLSCYS